MSWFLGTAGKRVVVSGIVVFSMSGFAYHTYLDTVFIDKYRNMTELYQKGSALPPPPSIIQVFEKVKKDLQFSTEESESVTLYLSRGFDYYKKGSLYKEYGLGFKKAVVGVPVSLGWNKDDDFDAKGIILNNETVQWNSAEGKLLKESLLLSDDAKKYAMAEHLAYFTFPIPLINGSLTTFLLMATCVYSRTINQRFNLHAGPKLRRYFAYTMVASLNAIFYMFVKDAMSCFVERKIDEKVAALGPEYINGGEDFYRQTMSKNVALRTLYGDGGTKFYTASGNLEVFIRQERISLSARLDFFKKLKKEAAEFKEVKV